MKKATFKIRRKIIFAFLFSLLSVLIFSIFSFQVHREIGHRLRLLELTDDLFQTVLELRRVEKNFFLYRRAASLADAEKYLSHARDMYQSHETEILRLKSPPQQPVFSRSLDRYQKILNQIKAQTPEAGTAQENQISISLEDALRRQGQELLNTTEKWEKEERLQIDRLFQRAMILFIISVVVFLALGIVVAFYLSRMLVQPLLQMQQAMDKIAHGDFTPLPEPTQSSEEFFALFRAFNRMIHELEVHQEQLVQSRKIAAVGTLTSGIAHELNNPINNIVLTAEALQEDFREMTQEEAQGLIHDILMQSERASEIVKGLLDFSRAERPEFEALPIGAVIQDTLKLVRNQLTLSGINVEQDIPPDLPRIRGEKKTLQQVFLNLFINAIQAMLDGGQLQIKARLAPDSRWMIIDVTDTGIGIEPEHLTRIFDPFYTTKQVGRGTGLGLSVTYGIIEKHGGHIEVTSRKGEGSTFTLTLPVYQEASLAEPSGVP
ncbi:MAG: HAMP domain-containing histidine kinase [Syntrophobacterales bacterium]|jgi:signal transduction histidine kinase|nr:HAMP domain-containing histidine kinase [Syntrophobacterales bacterium]